MKARAPYVLIGILLGVIVMQWAMPAAQGQGSAQVFEDLTAKAFTLVDESGNIKARMWSTPSGNALLSFGSERGDANVSIGSSGKNAWVIVTSGEAAESIALLAAQGLPVTMEIKTKGEASIEMLSDAGGRFSAEMTPAGPILWMSAGAPYVAAMVTNDGANLQISRGLDGPHISLSTLTGFMPGILVYGDGEDGEISLRKEPGRGTDGDSAQLLVTKDGGSVVATHDGTITAQLPVSLDLTASKS